MIYFNKLIDICINRHERKVVDNYDVRSIEVLQKTNMDKKAHEALERIRKEVTLTTSDLENQDAAEFFNELADWAYANGEAMLIDDEPEKQDGEEE